MFVRTNSYLKSKHSSEKEELTCPKKTPRFPHSNWRYQCWSFRILWTWLPYFLPCTHLKEKTCLSGIPQKAAPNKGLQQHQRHDFSFYFPRRDLLDWIPTANIFVKIFHTIKDTTHILQFVDTPSSNWESISAGYLAGIRFVRVHIIAYRLSQVFGRLKAWICQIPMIIIVKVGRWRPKNISSCQRYYHREGKAYYYGCCIGRHGHAIVLGNKSCVVSLG